AALGHTPIPEGSQARVWERVRQGHAAEPLSPDLPTGITAQTPLSYPDGSRSAPIRGAGSRRGTKG
ncbi:MAG: hypothetical protein LC667_14020, partial [Thioalkalivibrio sp.]|nr:hypothetical protein [Thioalkalivibrio sp.]